MTTPLEDFCAAIEANSPDRLCAALARDSSLPRQTPPQQTKPMFVGGMLTANMGPDTPDWIHYAVLHGADKVIALLAEWGVPLEERVDSPLRSPPSGGDRECAPGTYTPLLRAARTRPHAVTAALIHAGANMHAVTGNGDSLPTIVCSSLAYSGNENDYKAILPLRALGLNVNTAKDPLKQAMATGIINMIKAGLNFYNAYGLSAPADPFKIDAEALAQSINRAAKTAGHGKYGSKIAAFVWDTTTKFNEKKKWGKADFFTPDGSLDPLVYRYEGCGLLDGLFSEHGVKLWKGGLKNMLEAHVALPESVQENLPLIGGVLREHATPREKSVTVDYLHGAVPERTR